MSNEIEQATMRDVARVAGVSLATVSYVVNGGPRPVSTRSRRRVLAAIEELGYKARRKRSADITLGLIVPHATNAFFARVVAGVEAALGPDEYVLTCSSGEDPARERELVRLMLGHKVDGLLVTPCTGVPPEVERLPALGVPVVVMDRDAATTSLNAVTMNNYGSAVKATRLLAASGHRRIALLNGPERVDTARERRRGDPAALGAPGPPPVRQYIRDRRFRRGHRA